MFFSPITERIVKQNQSHSELYLLLKNLSIDEKLVFFYLVIEQVYFHSSWCIALFPTVVRQRHFENN